MIHCVLYMYIIPPRILVSAGIRLITFMCTFIFGLFIISSVSLPYIVLSSR